MNVEICKMGFKNSDRALYLHIFKMLNLKVNFAQYFFQILKSAYVYVYN